MKRTTTETKAIKAYIASIRENVTNRSNTAYFICASHTIADLLEGYLKERPTLTTKDMRNRLSRLEEALVEDCGSKGVLNYVLTFLEGLEMAKNWPFKD